jgi:hypothetical protein
MSAAMKSFVSKRLNAPLRNLPMENRSNSWYPAWAVIENRGDKLALFSGEVPIYWKRKVAQSRADEFNNGANHVRVEKVTIHRVSR